MGIYPLSRLVIICNPFECEDDFNEQERRTLENATTGWWKSNGVDFTEDKTDSSTKSKMTKCKKKITTPEKQCIDRKHNV
jgi:hypothetical protein